MEQRLEDHERRILALESGMAENTRITKDVRDNTRELLSWFREYQAGLRAAGRIGVMVKWVIAIGAGVATMWASVHWPKP